MDYSLDRTATEIVDMALVEMKKTVDYRLKREHSLTLNTYKNKSLLI